MPSNQHHHHRRRPRHNPYEDNQVPQDSHCTEWVWDDETNCYISRRLNANGQTIAWRYSRHSDGSNPTETPVDESSPRGDYQQTTESTSSDVGALSGEFGAFTFGEKGKAVDLAPPSASLGVQGYGVSGTYFPQNNFPQPSNYPTSYYNPSGAPLSSYDSTSMMLTTSSGFQSSNNMLSVPEPKWIRGSKGRKEKLDPNYCVHHEREFQTGQIFKILWSEPKGTVGSSITTHGTEMVPAKYGEDAYHSIRRFIVIKPLRGHSICVPILTYGGKATTKPGVHAEHHAIIFTGKDDDVPPLHYNEEQLPNPPIRMDAKIAKEKLDPMSRINYAKPYTVEHNVKVLFIGSVNKKYMKRLENGYNSIHSYTQNSYDNNNDTRQV